MRITTIQLVISLACLLVGTQTIQAQGTVLFSNGEPEIGPSQYQDVNAPFFDNQGVPLAGSAYLAELYYGSSANSLSPVGNPVSFGSGGYFYGGGLMLPTGPGIPAWVQVRAWAATGGSTYEQSLADGAWTGESNVLYVPKPGGAGLPPSLPAELIGLKFLGVPEPSAVVLSLIGAVWLAFFERRRKSEHLAWPAALPDRRSLDFVRIGFSPNFRLSIHRLMALQTPTGETS